MGAVWDFWKTYVVDLRVIEVSTLLFIAWQVFAIRRQTDLDHERSRRLRALDDLRWFVDQIKPEHHRIAKVLDELPHEAIVAIRHSKGFTMSDALKADVERILANRLQEKSVVLQSESDRVTISDSNSTTLRAITIGYLNLIEVVLAPMYSGVSDERILKAQLHSHFFHDDGRPKLKFVRETWGEKSLPSSVTFFRELEAEKLLGVERQRLHPLARIKDLPTKE